IRDAVRGLPADSRVKQVADALLSWNGQQVDAGHSGVYSSPGVAIYYEWLTVALEKLYGPVLPEKYLGGCESKIATFNCPYGQPLSAAVLYSTLTKGSTGSPVP